MKRKYWIILLSLVACVVIYFVFFNKRQEVQWLTSKAERGDIVIGVTATGTLSAETTIDVGTQVSGVISKLYADFNSEVKKGQVIAVLDTTSLSVSVMDAETNLSSAQARYNQVKMEYDRNKMLLEKKIIPQAEYDLSYTNLQTASNDIRSARAQLSRTRINLKYAKIISPIDGIVISRSVNVGQTVAASFNTPTLFTIVNDLSKMQVTASVDEADIGQIEIGQKVIFTVDAYNEDVYEGVVKQIRIQPVVVQNVVTYAVVIDANNPGKKLMPGMTANITIIKNEKKNLIKIPVNALSFFPAKEFRKEFIKHLPDSIKDKVDKYLPLSPKDRSQKRSGKDFKKGDAKILWVKKGEFIYPVKVATGMTDGVMIEIKGNIKEDDEILVGMMVQQKEQGQQKSPFMPQMRPARRK